MRPPPQGLTVLSWPFLGCYHCSPKGPHLPAGGRGGGWRAAGQCKHTHPKAESAVTPGTPCPRTASQGWRSGSGAQNLPSENSRSRAPYRPSFIHRPQPLSAKPVGSQTSFLLQANASGCQLKTQYFLRTVLRPAHTAEVTPMGVLSHPRAHFEAARWGASELRSSCTSNVHFTRHRASIPFGLLLFSSKLGINCAFLYF